MINLPIKFIGSDGEETDDKVHGAPCIKVRLLRQDEMGIEVWACLDTGADYNCLDTEVVKKLALPVQGFITANAESTSTHLVTVAPVGAGRRLVFEAAARDLQRHGNGFHMLLGRQFLAYGSFNFDSRAGKQTTFTLAQ